MENQANEVVHQIIQVATTYGMDIVGAIAILIIGWIAAGITISFPQRWLHIESGALPKD